MHLYFPFLDRRLQTKTHPPPLFFSQHFLEVFPVAFYSPVELLLRGLWMLRALFYSSPVRGIGGFGLLFFQIVLNQMALWCVCWDGFLQGLLGLW